MPQPEQPPGADAPQRQASPLKRLLRNPKLRGEAMWVTINKLGEVVLLFALLKLLTNQLSKEVYGEFALVVALQALVSGLSFRPLWTSFSRRFHHARSSGVLRSTVTQTGRWVLWLTLIVILVSLGITALHTPSWAVHRWTPPAAGLYYCSIGLLYLSQAVLLIQRRQRALAGNNVGALASRLVGASLVIWWLGDTVAGVLLAATAANAAVALGTLRPFWRSLRDQPSDPDVELRPLIRSFGIPSGLVGALGAFQQMGDRWVTAAFLDLATLGGYAAVSQIASAPYRILLSLIETLLMPVAYQRAQDRDDPRQLLAGDRVVLGGVALYLLLGGAGTVLFAVIGAWLVTAMTSADYAVSSTIVFAVALGRFLGGLGPVVRLFFEVHHAMGRWLAFDLAGAILALTCFVTGAWLGGLEGVAWGTAASGILYVAMILLAPNGLIRMLKATRAEARALA